jgi:hypothetical protein
MWVFGGSVLHVFERVEFWDFRWRNVYFVRIICELGERLFILGFRGRVQSIFMRRDRLPWNQKRVLGKG